MSSPVSYDLQGQGGGQLLSTGIGAVQTATNVRWIQCLTDCVFSSFTSSNIASMGYVTSKTIPAGVGIGGRFESVTLTSGDAIAYYR